MKLELSVIEEPSALEALRPEWLRLLAESEAPAPAMTPDWLLSWWRVFGDGRQLRVGLFHAGGRLVGLAPLCARRHWYRGCLPFRRLELLGTGEDEADEICSDYAGILAQRGLEPDVAGALVAGLVSGAFGVWDELLMPAMNGQNPLPELLERSLRQSGIVTTRATTAQSPYIRLPATWDLYLASLTGSHRALVRRTLREFESWSGGAAEVHWVATADELATGVEILRRLHAERWSEDRDGGVFSSPKFSAFHQQLMPQLLEAGQLELGWLAVRGEPVAAHYNLVFGSKVYFYQGGRKLDLPRAVRPGTALHAYAIRRAIELGRTEYDFLAGAQRYKLELSQSLRPLVELRAVRPVVRESARRVLELGAAQVRTLRVGLRRLRLPPAAVTA